LFQSNSTTLIMKKAFSILLLIAPFFSYGQNISIANTTVVEGNGGQQTVEVMVIISPAPETDIDINYNTKNGTALAGSDYTQASGTLHFKKGETMKKITVTINGDKSCEPKESFDIVLSNATAGTITNGTGTVTIADEDCMAAGGPGPAKYEIRLTFNGYTTLFIGPPECPIRPKGKVVLYGIVEGKEQVPTDDDINYRGELQLDIDIDICSVIRVNGEDKFCGMTVTGSGPVDVDLEVRYDARGGYIKMENKSGRFIRSIKGSCDQAEMDEELTMIPNKTIASIFNGLELTTLIQRTLTPGTYREPASDGNELIIEVIRKIH